MQGSGLNFTQGHYSDPFASLQASLGAGSMFAKTLSSMQQFDQDEAKLQMMRQDRERQAKLDAKVEAADALTAKREAYNLGAEKAVNSVQAKDDLGNQMFEHGLTNPEQAMLVNQADSQIKATNAGFRVADSLVGIDRSRLAEDKQKRYDELAAADGSLNTKGYNGKDSYNISTKLGLLKDSYVLGGLGEQEAYTKAAKSLGISSDAVKGVTASNDEQSAFVNRYSNLAQNDPLFGKSKLDKLGDYEASWAKEHGDTNFSTTGVQGLKSSLMSANTAAIAEQKKELTSLYAQRAAAGETATNKNLDNAIRLAEMRIRAADHETSSEEKLAKALTGAVGTTKLTDQDKYAINLASHLKQYAVSSKPEVGQNITEAYRQAQAKGYSAAEASALVQGGIHADGIPEKNAGQEYKFDSQAMFKRGPSKSYADNTDYVALRQQQLSSNDAQKEAEFDQLQKLFAAKGGSSTLAALDKQIYDIKRTPQEAFRQAAMQAGKDFAYDRDLVGHKVIADTKIAAEQTASENIGELPGAPTVKEKPNAKVRKDGTPLTATDYAKNLFLKRENSDQYGIHSDHYDDPSKNTRNKGWAARPAIGAGYDLYDVNASLPAGLPKLPVPKNEKDMSYIAAGTSLLNGSRGAEYKAAISKFGDKFLEKELDDTANRLSDVNLSSKSGMQLHAAIGSLGHQYGTGNGLFKDISKSVNAKLAKDDVQGAIDYVQGRLIGTKYADRHQDIISALKIYGSENGATGIKTRDEQYKFAKKSDFLDYYNKVYKQISDPKSGYSANDIDQYMSSLRDSAAGQKFGGIEYKHLGKTSPSANTEALKTALQSRIVEQNAETDRTNKSFHNSDMIMHPITTFQVSQENRDSVLKAKSLNYQLQSIDTQSKLSSKMAELNMLRTSTSKSKKASDRVAIDNAEQEVQRLQNLLKSQSWLGQAKVD